MTGEITVERQDGVAVVTMNRPEKLNAMTLAMYQQFGRAFDELSANDGVRCVVLVGAGDKAFCPGSDISEFTVERGSVEQAKCYAQLTLEMTNRLRDCRHPTVAAIKGVCVGGGLELAAMCDLRICGESSRFGIPINRLGCTMDYDELAMLTELLGTRVVGEILIDGRIFGAEEALTKGLVSRVVLDDEVDKEVAATARRIAEAAPLVNRSHKKFLRRLRSPEPLDADEREEAYHCFETEDYRIGLEAFAARRRPVFIGR